ncbi:MAG: nucleotidyltransferase family protein, partial [Tepidisphaeraceae bacterium]
MIDLIERNREQIVALCKKHGVKRLELFGSAARDEDFDPKTSDVDFLYVMDED